MDSRNLVSYNSKQIVWNYSKATQAYTKEISELEIIAKLWSTPKKRKDLDPTTKDSRQPNNISNIFIHFRNFNNNYNPNFIKSKFKNYFNCIRILFNSDWPESKISSTN